ncbi:Mitochondrial transcription termination factor-like [Rhynchospora pubera]|uniref:Mitochondrial transcription termination factor-like n=1 Tax=Rhynchospora pubera TaxID=906938 RepID=A0AAV8BP68_9POAL|nr:Mitochondrial transcription termination factor-like [Rhynchospora pubera]
MPSVLVKRIFSSSSYPFHHHHHFHQLILLTPLLRHYLSTQCPQPKELPFIAQYLISSFGFSPHRAFKCSADSNLRAVKSSERPDSVVAFLKATGLSHDQIKAVVSFHPYVLARNVEKTLKPKVGELINGGFSGELLVHLIRYNPAALERRDTLSRLLFWRDFVGNNNQVLLKIIKRNTLLLIRDIDKHIVPRINLLKEYGLSSPDIVSLIGSGNRCLKQNLDSFKQTLQIIEELGISRGSRMFVAGLKAIGGYSKDKIKGKVEFFMVTYGWSEEEVHAAFRKYPTVLSYSGNKVKSNMDFLVRKAGFESRSIALQPMLLGYSVQKVLIPRYTVLRDLQAKGLKKKYSLFSAAVMSESNFLERYVVPHEKDVPGLGAAYAAACGVKVPI